MKVSEIFHSIEGEGIAVGKPEVFVRLSGCNLRCRWCDTKYTWEAEEREEISFDQIIDEIKSFPCKNVSITGGEPLLREGVLELVKSLKSMGYWIQVNTNGTIFDSNVFGLVDLVTMDCKCPSSGEESDIEVVKETVSTFGSKTQIKFVITDEEDYRYARNIVSTVLENPTHVIFQPEWGSRSFINKLVELVKHDNLNVRIMLQQHKVIWGDVAGK